MPDIQRQLSLCNMSRRSSEIMGVFIYGTRDPGGGSLCDRLQTIALGPFLMHSTGTKSSEW